MAERPRLLRDLLRALPDGVSGGDDPTRITFLTDDSRAVRPGSLFVAITGTARDGHDHLEEALSAGAAALVVERAPANAPGVPVIQVSDSRSALSRLAAEWHGRPAEALRLVGITGTVGKTSVLAMVEAILARAGRRVAAIGSLGASVRGRAQGTGHTTPGPLLLQEELARAKDEGAEVAAMEVTSHALAQERVHGLTFQLGIFTNLLPLEHEDYHGSFRGYVEAKRRFFDHLPRGAPLIHSSDSPALRGLLEDQELTMVGCGVSPEAALQVNRIEATLEGTGLWFSLQRPLRRLDGSQADPVSFALSLRLLGRANRFNATLAAAAALALGADPPHIQEALEALPPQRRRLELIRRDPFAVLDDTIGHPESVTALFETLQRLQFRRLHAVIAIRGRRGARINRALAQALAIWRRRVPVDTLVVTRAEGSADERNRVSEEERRAFVGALQEEGVEFRERDRLEDAVPEVLESAREGDLVLLLGAQGMNGGAEIARRWLDGR